MKEQIAKDKIIDALKHGDNKLIEIFLYNQCYPFIEVYVLRNSGTKADAQDVFQDATIAILDIIIQNDKYVICSVKTLLFSIAKHLWLRKLNKNSKTHKISEKNLTSLVSEPKYFESPDIKDLIDEQVLFDISKMISDDCYHILITKDSENRRKRYVYKQKLKEMLENIDIETLVKKLQK